ncbi:hypothetical protein L6V77_02840 [Myxococcota bacterium]|nr:hypothetical protein [Myxococcota bacterium]
MPVRALVVVLTAAASPHYLELCAPCHGVGGRGDGPAAAYLLPRPRDLVAEPFRNGEDAGALRRTLVDGMPATGMPAFAALTAAELDHLVDDVLALRRGAYAAVEAPPPLWPSRPLPPLPPLPSGTPPILVTPGADACGRCHPAQAEQWSRSRHALAFGPGVELQQPAAPHAPNEACTACHAPLFEQQTDEALRSEGVTCAGCHRRGDEKLAARPPSGHRAPGLPVRVDSAFGRAELCLPCHMLPMSAAVAGRPLLDTWREWALSPYFVARIPCQTCHFADGDHALRGVHDPEAVRRAVRLLIEPEGAGPVATVTNVGAGHAFPTTATPRAVLRMRQLDAAERPIAGTDVMFAIGRTVYATPGGAGWTEIADTRIGPGQTSRFPYGVPRAEDGTTLEVDLFMYPDWLYGRIFTAAAARDARFAAVAGEARGHGFRVTGRRWRWPNP